LNHAKQVLAEIKQQGIDVDWSQVDVGEPSES
jgi:arabinogalactan endo-1,4-beta-galactosidase